MIDSVAKDKKVKLPALDRESKGHLLVENIERGEHMAFDLQMLGVEIAKWNFVPNHRELQILISILTGEFPPEARTMVSLIFLTLSKQSGAMIADLVEFGAVEAAMTVFPEHQVYVFLAEMARSNLTAAKKLFEYGIQGRIVDVCKETPSLVTGLVQLAGSLFEFEILERESFVLFKWLVKLLLLYRGTETETDIVKALSSAVSVAKLAQEYAESEEFLEFLQSLSGRDIDNIEFWKAVYCLLEGITKIDTTPVLMRAILNFAFSGLTDLPDEHIWITALDTIENVVKTEKGCEYVPICDELGIIDYLLSEYESDKSFKYRSGVLKCLCVMFSRSMLKIQEKMLNAGLFEFVVRDGQSLTDIAVSLTEFLVTLIEQFGRPDDDRLDDLLYFLHQSTDSEVVQRLSFLTL